MNRVGKCQQNDIMKLPRLITYYKIICVVGLLFSGNVCVNMSIMQQGESCSKFLLYFVEDSEFNV